MNHPTELLSGCVLGDLDPQEQERVDIHLLGCAACRAEVAQLRDALFSLVEALPGAVPPATTWERIKVRRAVHPLSARPARPSRLFGPGLWLAAGMILLVLLGGLVVRGWTTPDQTVQAAVQHWEAQGATRRPLTSQEGLPFGTLLVRPDGQALIVLSRPAPDGQVYQAWGRQASGSQAGVPVSLGLTDGVVMQVAWTGYDSVGVSVEPVGGSPAPTRPLGRADVRG